MKYNNFELIYFDIDTTSGTLAYTEDHKITEIAAICENDARPVFRCGTNYWAEMPKNKKRSVNLTLSSEKQCLITLIKWFNRIWKQNISVPQLQEFRRENFN